jgi:hypothetical protein
MTRCNGTWQIQSKVPTTPIIRYRPVGSSVWQEVVGGTRYELKPVYGKRTDRFYILKIEMEWRWRLRDSQMNGFTFWRRKATFYSDPIQGEIIPNGASSPGVIGAHYTTLETYPWASLGWVSVQRKNAQGQIETVAAKNNINAGFAAWNQNNNPHTNTVEPVGVPKDPYTFGTVEGYFQGIYWYLWQSGGIYLVQVDRAEIVEILPASSNQPPDGNKLIIRDCQNQILVEYDSPTLIEVETIASVMPPTFKIVLLSPEQRTSLGYPLEGFYLVIDRANPHDIEVWLRHDANPQLNQSIEKLTKHPCADGSIELEITCTDKNKCPPHTCEITCGDHRCCIDAQGYPVQELPL